MRPVLFVMWCPVVTSFALASQRGTRQPTGHPAGASAGDEDTLAIWGPACFTLYIRCWPLLLRRVVSGHPLMSPRRYLVSSCG